MGCEVFYQVTFIPTRSTELTSKREGNCNIMITGPVSHGLHMILHMIYRLILHFFTTSAINSFSHQHIATTTSSLLYRLGHQSILALFGAEILLVTCNPNKQFALILGSREKTICRPTPFQIWCWWSERSIVTLYK